MSESETILCGRVAYDVENGEWVMYMEEGFVGMADLYRAINRELERQGNAPLSVGDELTIRLKRDSKNQK